MKVHRVNVVVSLCSIAHTTRKIKIHYKDYFMLSSSFEHSSHTVSSSFEVNNLPHEEHFIV